MCAEIIALALGCVSECEREREGKQESSASLNIEDCRVNK